MASNTIIPAVKFTSITFRGVGGVANLFDNPHVDDFKTEKLLFLNRVVPNLESFSDYYLGDAPDDTRSVPTEEDIIYFNEDKNRILNEFTYVAETSTLVRDRLKEQLRSLTTFTVPQTTTVKLDLAVLDRTNQNNFASWFSRENVQKYIKVLLFYSKEKGTEFRTFAGTFDPPTDIATNGQYYTTNHLFYLLNQLPNQTVSVPENVAFTSFNDLLKKARDGDIPEQFIRTLTLSDYITGNITDYLYDDGIDRYYQYPLTINIQNEDYEHLTVFAIPYVDIEQLGLDNGVSITFDSFEAIELPFAYYFEIIKDGNFVNDPKIFDQRIESSIFTLISDFSDFSELPENVIVSLDLQTREELNNSYNFENTVQNYSNNNSKVTDLFISKYTNNNVYGMFGFDFKNTLINNSYYKDLLINSGRFYQDYFLSRSVIKNIKINKKFIKTKNFVNKLQIQYVDFEDLKDPINIASLSDSTLIEETNLQLTSNLYKFYSFKDTDSNYGSYSYSYEINIEDSTYQVLYDIFERCIRAYQNLLQYSNIINIPKSNINDVINTLNPHIDSTQDTVPQQLEFGYYNRITKTANLPSFYNESFIRNICSRLSEMLVVLSSFKLAPRSTTQLENAALTNKLFDLIYPQGFFDIVTGIPIVINLYEKSLLKFEKLLNIKSNLSLDNFSQTGIANNNITISNEFRSYIDKNYFNDYKINIFNFYQAYNISSGATNLPLLIDPINFTNVNDNMYCILQPDKNSYLFEDVFVGEAITALSDARTKEGRVLVQYYSYLNKFLKVQEFVFLDTSESVSVDGVESPMSVLANDNNCIISFKGLREKRNIVDNPTNLIQNFNFNNIVQSETFEQKARAVIDLPTPTDLIYDQKYVDSLNELSMTLFADFRKEKISDRNFRNYASTILQDTINLYSPKCLVEYLSNVSDFNELVWQPLTENIYINLPDTSYLVCRLTVVDYNTNNITKEIIDNISIPNQYFILAKNIDVELVQAQQFFAIPPPISEESSRFNLRQQFVTTRRARNNIPSTESPFNLQQNISDMLVINERITEQFNLQQNISNLIQPVAEARRQTPLSRFSVTGSR